MGLAEEPLYIANVHLSGQPIRGRVRGRVRMEG